MAAKPSPVFLRHMARGLELFEADEEVFGERTPIGHFECARNQKRLVGGMGRSRRVCPTRRAADHAILGHRFDGCAVALRAWNRL